MIFCPCGTKKDYAECCKPFITHEALPPTPEALMRSRYTAFTQKNTDYIQATMTSPSLDEFDEKETKDWLNHVKWQRLEIAHAEHNDKTGTVEFIAHFSHCNEEQYLHERSDFRFEDGKWVYVDGHEPQKHEPFVSEHKVGRNDPCHCGSGKKFKKCCA